MNVRRALACSLAVVLIVAGGIFLGWWGANGFSTEVYFDIDRAQIQTRVDEHFPQKSCALMMACVTVSAPTVVLSEGSDRVGLAADVIVQLGRRQMPGKIAVSGVLRYVRYEGDFYLDDIQIDDLGLEGFPPELAEVIRSRAPGALRRALEGHPVYSIKSDNARTAFAKLAVRDVRVVGDKVRVSFFRFAW